MMSSPSSLKNIDFKQLVIVGTLILSLCFIFWTQARFPALDEKVQMGSRAEIAGIGFETLLETDSTAHYFSRVVVTSINWLYSNWQGMLFGLLLGSLLLYLLSQLKRGQALGSSRFEHLKGMLYGAPLAVCANCATPIASGIHTQRPSMRLALAMVSSSPTLNIYVLTLAFAFLPLHLIVIQLCMVALYLIVALPLLVQRSAFADAPVNHDKDAETEVSDPRSARWVDAINAVLHGWLSSLIHIARIAIPLMCLAGLLGGLLFETNWLQSLINQPVTLIGLIVLSALCLFLPVPIAFDLILAITLWQWGLDPAYVTVIWFTLGIFSIFPAMTFGRTLGIARLWAIGVGLISIATVGAYAAQHWDKQMSDRDISALQNAYSSAESQRLQVLDNQVFELCARQGPEAQFDCLQLWLAQHVSSKDSVARCEGQGRSERLVQACRDEVHYRQTMNDILTNRLTEKCQTLGAQYQQRCALESAIDQAASDGQLGICLELEPKAQQACVGEASALYFESYGGSSICNTLTTDAQNNCLFDFEFRKRVQSYDLNQCHDLPNTQLIAQCQGSVAVQQLENGAPATFCLQMSDPYSRSICQDYARLVELKHQADVLSESVDCEALTASPLLPLCQSSLLKKKIDGIFSEANSLRIKTQITQQGNRPEQTLRIDNYAPQKVVPITWSGLVSANSSQLDIAYFAPQEAAMDGGGKPFSQIDADAIGLDLDLSLDPLSGFEPFSYGSALVASHINSDVWPDIALVHQGDVLIYLNTRGQFTLSTRVRYPNRALSLALVDLNGDRYPEIVTGHQSGLIQIIKGQAEGFSIDQTISYQLPEQGIVMSLAFADSNRDGYLDIAAGLWTSGNRGQFSPHQSSNYWLENRSGDSNEIAFSHQLLPGAKGETLSLLFVDLDRDGLEELLIGNDSDVGDQVMQFTAGKWIALNRNQAGLSGSSLNTMSFALGDINHDDRPDVFSTDMSFGPDEGVQYCDGLRKADQARCLDTVKALSGIDAFDLPACEALSESEQSTCLSAMSIELAYRTRDASVCEPIPASLPSYRVLCAEAALGPQPRDALDESDTLRSEQRNHLHLSTTIDRQYTEQASALGLDESYWSWHAQFADIDNDGDQELYVGNGFGFGSRNRHLHSNVLFKKQTNLAYQDIAEEVGLEDYLNTPTFNWFDFDLDGDLDLVSYPVSAPLQVHKNNASNHSAPEQAKQNRFVSLHLVDESGSASCIGCQIKLIDEQGIQVRSIHMSGGFWSFDTQWQHFGLGGLTSPVDLVIKWPDGEESKVSQLPVNRFYRISRKTSQKRVE